MPRWKLKNPSRETAYQRKWLETDKGVEYRKKHSEYVKEWRRKNRDKFLATQKRGYAKMRLETLVRYCGDPPECACCGETEVVFLAIDHISGGGNIHRRKIDPDGKIGGNGFGYWLKKNGWPKGFQVLCFNCNWAKSHGGCPHNKNLQ